MFRDRQQKPHSYNESESSPEFKCERCSQQYDDNQILVSVSPKIIRLSKDYPRDTTMVIENKNHFPVFFKTCSTNMNAFVPYPTTGRISPHNIVSFEDFVYILM